MTVGLLLCSNVFMTFAWYAHLQQMSNQPWAVAALVIWGVALFEFLVQVPTNRIGFTVLSVGPLKILQEIITLSVFAPFSVFYLREPLKLDKLFGQAAAPLAGGRVVLGGRGLFHVPLPFPVARSKLAPAIRLTKVHSF